jgi:hypothetical protein
MDAFGNELRLAEERHQLERLPLLDDRSALPDGDRGG